MGHKSPKTINQLEQEARQHLKLFFDGLSNLPIQAIAHNGRNPGGEEYFCHQQTHGVLDALLAFVYVASDLNKSLPKQQRFMQGADQLALKLKSWMQKMQHEQLQLVCARLENLLESDGIPPFYDAYMTSLTAICRDLANEDVINSEKQRLTDEISACLRNSPSSLIKYSRVIKLRHACLGYQAHLRRCILEEAGLIQAYKDPREIELGEKLKGRHQFQTLNELWFDQQLKKLRHKNKSRSLDLLIQKYDATSSFIKILSNEHQSDFEKMQHFKKAFSQTKPLLEASRDNALTKFIKYVVLLMTGGIAGCFSLFHVHGRDLTKQAQQDLDDLQQGLYQRKDFCDLKMR